MLVSKKGGGNIILKCKACGARTDVDMSHRLATFVLRNPPPKEMFDYAKSKKSGGGSTGKTSDKKIEDMTKDDFSQKIETKWSADTSAEAVQRRREELLGKKSSSLVESGAKGNGAPQGNPIEALSVMLKEHLSAGEEKDDAAFAQKAKKHQENHNWADRKFLQILFGLLFSEEPEKMVDELGAKAPVLGLFVEESIHQKVVLLCMEKLCSAEPKVVDNMHNVLNAFYQLDILEEDILLKWYSHPNKKLDKATSKKIRGVAKPFIEWLQQEDDEDEDEEEDGEDGGEEEAEIDTDAL